LLKHKANFTVSSTLLPHSWFDSYKLLFCMREIFLKRILCLFKKLNHDEEHQPRSTVRIGLDQALDASAQAAVHTW
jgi:hypothetical protein